MGYQTWNEKFQMIKKVRMTGTKKLNGTLDNAAAVNNGDGTVAIPITGHGLVAGNKIRIAGSVAYNGVFTIINVPGANAINITTTFVVEVFAGTETYKTIFVPGEVFQLVETRFHLSDVSANEAITYTLDAEAGAAYDAQLDSNNLNALKDDVIVWIDGDKRRFFDDGDAILFEYANTNNRTWGLEIIYRKLA